MILSRVFRIPAAADLSIILTFRHQVRNDLLRYRTLPVTALHSGEGITLYTAVQEQMELGADESVKKLAAQRGGRSWRFKKMCEVFLALEGFSVHISRKRIDRFSLQITFEGAGNGKFTSASTTTSTQAAAEERCTNVKESKARCKQQEMKLSPGLNVT